MPARLRSAESVLPNCWRPKSVAVVIPCHNYGRYLAEAIESTLRQTRPADEVVVVDDASTDDTPQIARAFSARKVRYLRVECRHSQRTRRAGFLATRSDVVCFLDADDCLAEDYLATGMVAFEETRIGIVYSDVELFGGQSGRSNYPETFDRGLLSRMNYMHSGSLVLREALKISQALEVETDDRQVLQDWLLWRRVLDGGWTAKKQRALYRYRRHGSSMTARWDAWGTVPKEYFHRAGLASESVTLFVPLSGRAALWPDMAAFLDRQSWPREQTRLVLFDTSQNLDFSRQVRQWIGQCDYPDIRHLCESVGAIGLAERPRREAAREVSLAMARIYNRMAHEVTTDYVWVVEDDVIPPDGACESLLRGFDRQTASVSAVYPSRFSNAYVVWDLGQQMLSKRNGGLEDVGGNGFGCVMLRGEVVRQTVFTATLDAAAYDNAFYYRLPAFGLKAKVDWSIECRHHGANLAESAV